MSKTATMTFNPRCGTARKTKAILEEEGYEVTVIEYLKEPLERSELQRLLKKGGMSAHDALRAKEQIAKDMKLAEADEQTVLDAMMAHPILINRPIVETDKGVVLARPQDKVRDIL